jgi:hypothetical protein
MKSGFYAAVSAIALLSSGAVQAEPVTNGVNIASITQAASSSQTTATISQINSITSSSAYIVQDADGSGNDRATVAITQGDPSGNAASNTAKVTQQSVTNGADITLNQSGETGGTNYADVLQSALDGSSATITQYSGPGGTNTIGEQFSLNSNQSNLNDSVGFTQTGTGNTAIISQRTFGATNSMSGVVQNGTSTSFTVNQGLSLNAGGSNGIYNVTANGNLTVNQDSDSGTNVLRNFSGGGTNSTITQSASGGNNYIGFSTTVDVTNATVTINQTATGSGENNIGVDSAVSVTGGTLTINQTTAGSFNIVNLAMSGGTLDIKQLDENQGYGTVTIAAFSGGTGLIEQRAASNGGNNLITVESYDTSSSSVAVLQNGGDNSINVNRGNGSSDNNSDDDGTNSYGSAATVFDLFYSRLTIEQYGTSNTANLTQNTADNVGRIYQNGTGNAATINQTIRSGNTAFIVQLGSNGIATINQ